MEQVYLLSPASPAGSDTRSLTYRYGQFVYAGPVITEPVAGLEYLPGVLVGIQAVQGQVPYLCEVRDLPPSGTHAAALLTLQRAADTAFDLLEAHTDALAARAKEAGAEWLDDDDTNVYFELQAVAGYTCGVRRRAAATAHVRAPRWRRARHAAPAPAPAPSPFRRAPRSSLPSSTAASSC